MNDERFFELAMKVIARQSSDAERAELDALLARQPELRAEFKRLQTEARIAREALPLMNATEATAGEFPAYARGRLQSKVRQTLGRPESAEKEPDRSLAWGWRWWLGLATAAVVVLSVAIPTLVRPSSPVVQLALLDTAGTTRSSDTNDVLLLREAWKTARLDSFTNADAVRGWETRLSRRRDTVRIIYDRAAAEVRVSGKWRGESFEKTFLVEPDLPTTLSRVKSFLFDQTQK